MHTHFRFTAFTPVTPLEWFVWRDRSPHFNPQVAAATEDVFEERFAAAWDNDPVPGMGGRAEPAPAVPRDLLEPETRDLEEHAPKITERVIDSGE